MGDKTKILLWSAPRCVSTAFYRAMYNRPNTKCMHEHYALPFYWGKTRTSQRYKSESVNESYTYQNITKQLELFASDGDHDVFFVKDMAYYVIQQFKTDAFKEIPTDFQHIFLIRNPHRSIPSLHRLSTDKEGTGWNYFDPNEAGFKEVYDLYHQVTENTGHSPVVIDGDDLIRNPENMLQAFCDKVEISYHDSMVNWNEDPLSMGLTDEWGSAWFQPLFSTSKFETRLVTSDRKHDDLPEVVQKCIQENMKYYEYLYKLRLQV